MKNEPDAQTLKRPSARNCSWFHRHSVSWSCKHHYHCYHNSYLYLQAANTKLTFGLSAQIHLKFWRRGCNLVLCFYFPSVFAQILHLCTAEYLLLLHPEVFGAVNLAVLRVYPQGSGSTEYSEGFFLRTYIL